MSLFSWWTRCSLHPQHMPTNLQAEARHLHTWDLMAARLQFMPLHREWCACLYTESLFTQIKTRITTRITTNSDLWTWVNIQEGLQHLHMFCWWNKCCLHAESMSASQQEKARWSEMCTWHSLQEGLQHLSMFGWWTDWSLHSPVLCTKYRYTCFKFWATAIATAVHTLGL